MHAQAAVDPASARVSQNASIFARRDAFSSAEVLLRQDQFVERAHFRGVKRVVDLIAQPRLIGFAVLYGDLVAGAVTEDGEVEALSIEIEVPLSREFSAEPCPARASTCGALEVLLAPTGAGVVFLHMLGADAADRENVRIVAVLHVVDVTDVDTFAHLAKLGRLAEILHQVGVAVLAHLARRNLIRPWKR